MFNGLSSFISHLIEELARTLVIFGSAVLANFLIMHTYNAAWEIYIRTHIGERFLDSNSALSEQIFIFLNQSSFLTFSVDLVISTLLAAMLIAAISQFFYIRQLLYANASLFIKLIFGLMFAAALAKYHMHDYNISSLNVAVLMFVPSALIVLPASMTTAYHLLPDVGQLFVGLLNVIRNIFSR